VVYSYIGSIGYIPIQDGRRIGSNAAGIHREGCSAAARQGAGVTGTVVVTDALFVAITVLVTAPAALTAVSVWW
jgi:hypothetical protein